MSNGKIRLKKLSDLMQEAEAPVKSKTKTPKWKCKTVPESSSVLLSDNDSDFVDTNATPKRVKKQKELRGAPTTSKKTIEQPKTSKKVPKSNKKELGEGQTKIDSFFKSCSKSYQVEEKTNSNWQVRGNQTTGGKLQKNKSKTVKNMGRGRKRLFDDTTESDTDATTAPSCISGMTPKKPARKRSVKTGENKSENNNLFKEKPSIVACIDLISESEEEENCKETEDAIEKTQLQSAAEIVMQINNENSKETPPMVHVRISEEVTAPAVRNDICTRQTHAIYLGNKPLQTDIGMLTLSDPRTISNVMQHESSEVEDIGTLIQKEEEHQTQSAIDEITPPSFYVNNSNAVLQKLDNTDQQLLSCHTMNNSLADLRATKSVIQQLSSEIEETSIVIQKVELTETLLWSSQTNNLPLVDLEVSSSVIKQQSSEIEGIDHLIRKEEKENPQANVNNTEILHQNSIEHQQSSFHMNKPTNSDIEPTNSVNQSSEVEDIGILIQVEKEEYVLKSQSVLSIKCSLEERDAKQTKESYLPISDDENSLLPDENSLKPKSTCQRTTNNLKKKDELNIFDDLETLHSKKNSISVPEKINSKEVSIPQLNSKNQEKQLPETEEVIILNTTPEEERTKASTKKRKPRPCPPYKIVQGTTFAVDAFQFGLIKGVTHYFLTHFHADHYIGLTRKFSMQLFCSPVTARLLRVFIPLEESYIQEIELNNPQVIEGVEVTAIDANHCPGAVMFVFKLPTGKCILHTGDFRASPNMESEPIFWNNDIHTIYLDTTYISNKYAFCSQDESIDKAQHLIEQFQEKHKDKKILYICGAYLIGKERIWSSIARNNRLIVWTDVRRNKALRAMQDLDHLELLCANPISATMHLIPMGKLSYFSLVEYFEPFSSRFDICLAIRPSGWEKNSKPQYRGKINIIGVEYSEHSSYNELQRFVTYLNPQEVISTVPVSSNLMVTSEVPQAWYKYKKFPTQHRNFQPSITNYLKRKTKNVSSSEQNRDSSKENFLPNQLSQSDEYEDVKCSQKVLTDKLSLLHAADDADDDWLS